MFAAMSTVVDFALPFGYNEEIALEAIDAYHHTLMMQKGRTAGKV